MRRLYTIGILVLLVAKVFAQEVNYKKLESVQAASLRTPGPIKIDGKLGEWNNNFQAYNRSTRLIYTLSNDDKNLYLIAKSNDFTTVAKIISGGICLAINTDGKKKEQDSYSITFPVIENPQRLAGGLSNRFENRNAAADTELMRTVRQRTILAAKTIKVLGFKDITDTVISIYNEHSIKTAINFDETGAMTFELSVPLKSLNLNADKPKEFAYNLKLNGLQLNFGGGGPPGGGGGGGRPGGGGGRNALDFLDLLTPSDFWAKYTLAKK
ncbi:hypothetical protein [Mucilaginibacter antarcticus]|uniref:Uncharacterized protein n=1 Tax=Mucilaginibacter antarcticus TaxID=1855725 RepID=A0ABW5XKK7_9SPHI